jgi:hypothetical protein
MTAHGAMQLDVKYLQNGFFYVLPTPDDTGRPIVFFDRIGTTKQVASRDAIVRCAFYAAYMAANIYCQSTNV